MLKKSLWIIIFSCILHTNFIYSMGMMSSELISEKLTSVELQKDPIYGEVIACQSQGIKDIILEGMLNRYYDHSPDRLFHVAAAVLGGANPNIQYRRHTQHKQTVLFECLDDELFVKFFLEHGTNPNLEMNGVSPLMAAKKYAIVELLIKHGAQISDEEKSDGKNNLINLSLNNLNLGQPSLQAVVKLAQLYTQHGVSAHSSLLYLPKLISEASGLVSENKRPEMLEQMYLLIQTLIKSRANPNLTYHKAQLLHYSDLNLTPIKVAQAQITSLEKIDLREYGRSDCRYTIGYNRYVALKLFLIIANNPSLPAQEAIDQACPTTTIE